MTDSTWLKRRAGELFPRGMPWERGQAIQLAREALAAAAKECERAEIKQGSIGPLMDAGWNLARKHCAEIIRRIAGTTEQPDGPVWRADSTAGLARGTTFTEQSPTPGSLSDAAVRIAGLEQALRVAQEARCVIFKDAPAERARGAREACQWIEETIKSDIAKLRAADDPDVFEAFATAWVRHINARQPVDDRDTEKLAREWFAPLVEALEAISQPSPAPATEGATGWRIQKALTTLAALRERARAARGGGA